MERVRKIKFHQGITKKQNRAARRCGSEKLQEDFEHEVGSQEKKLQRRKAVTRKQPDEKHFIKN